MNSIAPVIRDQFEDLPETLDSLTVKKHRLLIVGDTNTVPLYGEEVRRETEKVFHEVFVFTVPSGEDQKNLDTIRTILRFLLEHHFDRKDCVAALGGGVIGDMAGFAASVYLRGIPVIQIPTTLLAQIDSSIGGKTGVDFEGYKNMVGAFHMPVLVYTNSSALTTLPDSQFISGLGEVVKSALLGDGEFFTWLNENREKILKRDKAALLYLIKKTAGIKVKVVEEDPTEQGVRATLNLGHTIGHAVEKFKHFELPHGVCVALGIAAAAYLSEKKGLISKEDEDAIESSLQGFELPVKTCDLDEREILRITKSDKKMADGQIRFILLKKIGEAYMDDTLTDDDLLAAIHYINGEEPDRKWM